MGHFETFEAVAAHFVDFQEIGPVDASHAILLKRREEYVSVSVYPIGESRRVRAIG